MRTGISNQPLHFQSLFARNNITTTTASIHGLSQSQRYFVKPTIQAQRSAKTYRRDRNTVNLEHVFKKKRSLFDQSRNPSQNPLHLQHGFDVVSGWQSSGIVDMPQLKTELTRIGFFFEAWPNSISESRTRSFSSSSIQQSSTYDVLIARFPHNLHNKYGQPSNNHNLSQLLSQQWEKATTKKTTNSNSKLSKTKAKAKTKTKEEEGEGKTGEDISSSNHNQNQNHNINNNSHNRVQSLSKDEEWNKNFWFHSDINEFIRKHDASLRQPQTQSQSQTQSQTQAQQNSENSNRVLSKSTVNLNLNKSLNKNLYSFLNYPSSGASHSSDADSPIGSSASMANTSDSNSNNKRSIKLLQQMTNTNKSKIANNISPNVEDFYSRGYVFIFNSGVIVTFGYSGSDRDWIDEFLGLYQDSKRGWPSFDGFNFPWHMKIRLAMSGANNSNSFLWPSDMQIVRSDFVNLNWIFQAWDPIKLNKKMSTNDVEQWTMNDVQAWLTSINLEQYCAIFADNEIDGNMLLKMTANIEQTIFMNSNHSNNSNQKQKQKQSHAPLKDYHQFQTEFKKLHINPEDIFTENDILHLPNTDLITLLTIAYSLSQCVRLEVLKMAVNYYQKNSMIITERLAKKGTEYFFLFGIRNKHWSRLVHHSEMLRHFLFDYGVQPVLTEQPYFIEQYASEVESLYEAVLNYMDFDSMLEDVDSQIDQLKDRYQSDWEASRDQYGARLEWFIIVFFAIDTREFWYPTCTHILQRISKRVQDIFGVSSPLRQRNMMEMESTEENELK